MLKRHEIEILLKAGHSKAEAARLSGASLRSVKRIAQEGPVVHIDDAGERAQRQIGGCLAQEECEGSGANSAAG